MTTVFFYYLHHLQPSRYVYFRKKTRLSHCAALRCAHIFKNNIVIVVIDGTRRVVK